MMFHIASFFYLALVVDSFSNSRFHPRKLLALYQTPSIPSWAELSQQKSEALKSITETHDGIWICESGAISTDGAGGSFFRSPPFKSSVSTRLGISNDQGDAIKFVETLSWGDDGNMIFGRSCALGSSVDVDSVDGSYSLHATISQENTSVSTSSSALPLSISGIDPIKVTSVIENCIMGHDHKRARCFFIYGKYSNSLSDSISSEEDVSDLEEQRLLRVVVSHETKEVDPNKTIKNVIQETLTKQQSNPLEVLSSSSSTEDNVEKFPVTMMTLSLGPWLGDLIIRDKSFNSILPSGKDDAVSSKGFGKQMKTSKRYSGGFGEWVLGVQKVAMSFKYDFDTSVRQVLTFGKSIGVHSDDLWPHHSSGIIYDDRMSRRIRVDDRSLYIDYDNGAYCGFIFDSVYAKASKYLTTRRQGSSLPMLTEFALFQKSKTTSDDDAENGKELYCSRITRLYNDDGSLSQGSTSFFTLKPMAPIEDISNTSSSNKLP